MGLGGLGPFGIIAILVVLLVFFGRGKIPQLMGDVAKGVTAFRKGLKDDPDAASSEEDAKTIEATAEKSAEEVTETKKTEA